MPGRRLMRVDASTESVVVACQCGWRYLGLDRAGAVRAADAHRELIHPRQATFLIAQRSRRGIGPRL